MADLATLPFTVVAIDNFTHELTRLAIEATLRVIDPERVLIFTDDPTKIAVIGADYFDIPITNNPDEGCLHAMKTLWYQVPLLIHTDHFMLVQWDGWPINASAFPIEALNYDYIGAPWAGYGGLVGNGGFSLRSVILARHIAANIDYYPLIQPEDYTLCVTYRKKLEADGFQWAPTTLAAQYSFESGSEVPTEGSVFGFHNCLNWLWALSHEERERHIRAARWDICSNAFHEMIHRHKYSIGRFPAVSHSRVAVRNDG